MKTSANPGDEQVGSIACRAAQDSLRGNPTRTDANRRVLRAAKGAGESVAERVGRPSRWGRAALRQCIDRWALLILFLVAVCAVRRACHGTSASVASEDR